LREALRFARGRGGAALGVGAFGFGTLCGCMFGRCTLGCRTFGLQATGFGERLGVPPLFGLQRGLALRLGLLRGQASGLPLRLLGGGKAVQLGLRFDALLLGAQRGLTARLLRFGREVLRLASCLLLSGAFAFGLCGIGAFGLGCRQVFALGLCLPGSPQFGVAAPPQLPTDQHAQGRRGQQPR